MRPAAYANMINGSWNGSFSVYGPHQLRLASFVHRAEHVVVREQVVEPEVFGRLHDATYGVRRYRRVRFVGIQRQCAYDESSPRQPLSCSPPAFLRRAAMTTTATTAPPTTAAVTATTAARRRHDDRDRRHELRVRQDDADGDGRSTGDVQDHQQRLGRAQPDDRRPERRQGRRGRRVSRSRP